MPNTYQYRIRIKTVTGEYEVVVDASSEEEVKEALTRAEIEEA